MVGRLLQFMVIKNSTSFISDSYAGSSESPHFYSSRRERDWVLGEFKSGRSPILIATDVASRGLGMFSLISFVFPSALEWLPSPWSAVKGDLAMFVRNTAGFDG